MYAFSQTITPETFEYSKTNPNVQQGKDPKMPEMFRFAYIIIRYYPNNSTFISWDTMGFPLEYVTLSKQISSAAYLSHLTVRT